MSLPLSPNTNYVTGTPILSQDLNDLQKYLSGLYTGAYTAKSLQVDGTGGNAGAAASGQVLAQTVTSTVGNNRTLWLPAGMGVAYAPQTGGFVYDSTSRAWKATGGGNGLVFGVPTRFQGVSRGFVVGQVSVVMKPAGASAVGATLFEVSGLSTYGGTPTITNLGSANSDGTTNLQFPGITPSGGPTATADIMMEVTVSSGQASDLIYGVLLVIGDEVY